MEPMPLAIPCLEDLSVIESRCRQMGLSVNYNFGDGGEVSSDAGKSDATNADLEAEQEEDGCHDDDDDDDDDVRPQVYDREYEVRAICDYKFEKGIDWYLVQWRGWSYKANTWEPKDHLANCRAKLIDFDRKLRINCLLPINGKLDRKRQLAVDERALKKSKTVCETKATSQNGAYKKQVTLSQMTLKKLRQLKSRLKEWQDEINEVSGEEAPIVVVNDIDFEGPPLDFVYINDYKAGEGIVIPDDPLVGCECASKCLECKDKCCGQLFGGEFAYDRWKRVKVPLGSPIYECNKRCKCGDDCSNRVVQHGRKIKLAIFRTANGCGWGVRTLQAIKMHTFVMEYVGEVITNEEAENRGKVYDAEGRTYLFDLDYHDDDCMFTVDAAHYGNVSHFMNHSCEPNLVVYSVWINTIDARLPRLAFFAKRDIVRGEELNFDYKMSGATSPTTPCETNDEQAKLRNDSSKRIRCKCASKNCRKYLF